MSKILPPHAPSRLPPAKVQAYADTNGIPPESEKLLRVTVPVSLEVLDTFKRMGVAGNTSTGKAMGEWLAETIDAAEFMAAKMEQARAAPKVVMRELHAYALAMADETGDLMRQLAAKGEADRSARKQRSLPQSADSASFPFSNTGRKGSKAKTENKTSTGRKPS